MPSSQIIPVPKAQSCIINKNGVNRQAYILQRRSGEVYVHYVDTDKRMDEWISEDFCMMNDPVPEVSDPGPKKRKRGSRWDVTTTTSFTQEASSSRQGLSTTTTTNGFPNVVDEERQANGSRFSAENILTEEEINLTRPKELTSQRNFDTVIFHEWKIRPWYYSPYPLLENETDEPLTPSSTNQPFQKVTGILKPPKTYGRTSDLLTGGLARQHTGDSTLWVCHFCFKYMVDGVPWELHKKDCKLKHPPGKKVYQRGAHTIWEVDGAREKLYCQNLSLFGKLFIDVKTLFFDCDNFLFYILTDANSAEDHILGFFSKEKLSYDDYNLACIMTLPQYQRKGYGMLMIEFSYELSRRAGTVGTPERPLSDLGLRSYLAYWVSTLIRFFRRVLSVLPPDVVSIINENEFPQLGEDGSGEEISGEVERISMKKRKKSKGFDGELSEGNVNAEANLCMMPMKDINETLFTTKRVFETTPNEYGGADTNVKVECTLEDIAKATNMRVDDAAFALNECGLLMRRLSSATGKDGETHGEVVVITRSLVEKVAKERNVKRMYLDLNCVIP